MSSRKRSDHLPCQMDGESRDITRNMDLPTDPARVSAAFFTQNVERVASSPIGVDLRVGGVGGPIFETEAYDATDPASYSFRGPTLRDAHMFGPPGQAYVYRSPGRHSCFNIVCGPQPGGAVLIRALAQYAGVEIMKQRRATADLRRLCSGPGRLCMARGIDTSLNGQRLDRPPFEIAFGASFGNVRQGPGVGITRAFETPRRCWAEKSPCVSRQGAR